MLFGPLKRDSRSSTLLNIIIFQLGWFICILAGDMWALLYAFAAALGHHLLFTVRWREWLFLGGWVSVGYLWDGLLFLNGALSHSALNAAKASNFSPSIWLLCLWFLMGLTLNHSLQYFHHRLLIAALLAALCAPMSYYSGALLTTVNLAEPLWHTLLLIGVGWAVIFPLGLFACRHYLQGEDTECVHAKG